MQTTAEQRAEAARLLAFRAKTGWWPEYERVGDRLPELLTALLADAEALAEIEAEGDRRRVALTNLMRLSAEYGLYDEDPGPPIVAGPLSRVPVTIRRGRPARAVRYDKGELTDD